MVKKLLLVTVCALWLGGCAPKIQFSEVSPRIAEFNPRTVVLLPFTNSIGMESANDATNNKMIGAISQAGMFDRIIEPSQVKVLMVSNPGVIDVITRFRTTWIATGICDPTISAWIGKAFNADSVAFGEVTAWSEQNDGRYFYYNAGMAFRWVDARTGVVLWKASEVFQKLAGYPCIFDCSNPDKTMDETVRMVVQAWPRTAGAPK
jgi:hypothetical protein